MTKALIVLCSFPSKEKALSASQDLLESKLAACVHVTAPVTSVFYWEGKLEQEQEVQAWIKTSQDSWPKLENRLKEIHPYEVPEILAIQVDEGHQAYLKWLEDCL